MRLILIAIALLLVSLLKNEPVFSEHSPTNNFREMEDYLVKRVNDFKLDFHRSFEQTRIKRKQRDNYLLTFGEKGVLIEEHLKVENVSSVFTGISFDNQSILTWTAIESVDQTYLFWGDSNGMLVLADLKVQPNGPQLKLLAQHIELANGLPFKSQYFLYDSFIWFVVAYRTPHREYLAVYQVIQHRFFRRQTIETDVKTDFDITDKGITYMAVSCYMRKTAVESSLESTLKLYEWRRTQFDFIAVQKIYSATSIKLFNMAGTLYMAVAQAIDHRNNNGNHYEFTTGSPVFVYNARDDDRLTYVQIIRTDSATRVEHFRVDGNDYLAFVSSKEDVRVFWWAGDQFLEFQILENTRLATNMGVIRLPNAEILLALVFPDRIKFYTESMNSRYVLSGELVLPQPQFTQFNTIDLFSYSNRNYFALFTFNKNPQQKSTPISPIWKVNLVPYESKNSPYSSDKLISCLLDLEQTLGRREEDLQRVTQRADRVWVTNKRQNISAPVIVRGKLRSNRFKSSNLLLKHTNSNDNYPQITNTMVKKRIDSANHTVSRVIGDDMRNVVHKSLNQTIDGPLIFTELINAFKSTVGNIANRDVAFNRVSFLDLSDNTLTINGDQIINAHFSFKNVTINFLDARALINRLNISDAMLANTPYPQTVTGNHRYTDVLMESDLHLNNQFGTINKILVPHFVTKSGDAQLISGRKSFQTLNARNIIVKGLTNGRDLSDIATRVVFLNGPTQVINGKLIIEAPIRAKKIKLNGLINKVVNITELAFNAVTIYGDQIITGTKTFSLPVTVAGNVEINGTINGVKLSRDAITTNTAQTLTGKLIFMAPVQFNGDINCLTVNGIDLSEEAVRKHSDKPQIVNTKRFNETFTVLEHITMDPKSTIDGVDPSELRNKLINSNELVFQTPVYFNKLTVRGNVFASTVNQYLINDLPNLLWLKSANQTIRVPVKFTGAVSIDRLFSRTVNNFRIPEDFVLKNRPNQVIYGEKKFVDTVVISGNIDVKENKKINGIDLSVFDKQYVRKDTFGTAIDNIAGIKHFKSIRVNGNLITNRVNRLNITRDILLTKGMQTINGNMVLAANNTIINGEIEVFGNINVNQTVNSVSLQQFVTQVILTDTPAAHYRPILNKQFAGGIGARRIMAAGTINGIDIDEMRSRVVTLDMPQQIYATKNFTQLTRFVGDVSSDYLNGVRFKEFVSKIILKHSATTVRGEKTFAGNVLMRSNLLTSGYINNIDTQSLQRKLMSRTRDNVILAPISFAGDVTVGELIVDAPALIDNLRPSDLALIGENIRLEGQITLNRAPRIGGAVNARLLVNGCDLRRLRSDAIYLNGANLRQTIFGVKQFVNLDVAGNVYLNGLINNVDINKLAANLVTKSANQELHASIVFNSDVYAENLLIRSLINGRNITALFQDAVLSRTPQTIVAKKQFNSALYLNGSRLRVVNGDVTVNGLVNGLNIISLNRSVVRQYDTEQIRGVKTFAGSAVTFNRNLFIVGAINGINVPNDLILLNTNEIIAGLTTFKNSVFCLKSLKAKHLIDGIDLSHFARNRVSLDYHEVINSTLNFLQPLKIDNLIVRQTINGIPVDAFVTRHGTHVITGNKVFLNDLFVAGNVLSPGIYNGINVHDLVNRSVSLIKPETIPGTTVFTSNVEMHHITITGLLNGIDISEMANFFKHHTSSVETSLSLVQNQLSSHEHDLVALFDSQVHDRSLGISYFVLSQELPDIGERFLINSYVNPLMNINPVDSLILWKYNEVYGCREYSSRVYKISSNGYLRSETNDQIGRIIPLFTRDMLDNTQLQLWTNSSDCVTSKNARTVIKTIHLNDVSNLHAKRRVVAEDSDPHSVVEAPLLIDSKLFVIGSDTYLVLANNFDPKTKSRHTNSTVLWLNPQTRQWTAIQQIETFGVTAIDLVTHQTARNRYIFLAVTNKLKSRVAIAPSYIMQWNYNTRQFDVNSIIDTSNPSSVLFVRSFAGELYAVFANEKSNLFQNDCGVDDNTYNEPIHIYRYNGIRFQYIQSVDIYGVVSLDWFMVANETYIAAASYYSKTTFILQLRGYNLFTVIQSFTTPGVQSLKSFWSADRTLHLAIASSEYGYTKILTAVVNGPQNAKKYMHIEHLMRDVNAIQHNRLN